MTTEERVDMYSMRINGATLQEITDKYSISKERVRQIVGSAAGSKNVDSVVFAGLRKWMIQNGCSVMSFARNFPDITYQHIYGCLTGKYSLSYKLIIRVLEFTGLTFEQAFAA